MTAATLQIDMDVLDELFNNQKKLDDALLFEDDFLFGTPTSTQHDSPKADAFASVPSEDLSFYTDDDFEVKSRSPLSLILTILVEVIAIYYGVMYFT